MSILSALFDRIEQTDALEISAAPRSQPAPDVPQGCTLVLLEPPVQQGHASPCWQVFIDGELICSMVGTPMTWEQATNAARWRWPAADVAHQVESPGRHFQSLTSQRPPEPPQ